MPAIPIIAAGTAIYGAVSQADAARKATNAAKDAANSPKSQIDIPALYNQTQQYAIQNAEASRALEQRLTPEIAALRTNSINAINQDINADPNAATRDSLLAMFNNDQPIQRSSLFDSALKVAQDDLGLGGALPKDVQNQILRAGLAKSGTATGNLGLGRDIGARDLGLNSLQLRQQRLTNAGQLGTTEMGFNQAQSQYRAQIAQLLSNMNNSDMARRLGYAQLGQQIALPNVGLDPGSIANLAVSNLNVQNGLAANAQNTANAGNTATNTAIGQLGGTLGGIYNNYYKPSNTSSPAPLPSSNTPMFDFSQGYTPMGNYSLSNVSGVGGQ